MNLQLLLIEQGNLTNLISLFLVFSFSVLVVIKFNRWRSTNSNLPPSPPKLPFIGNLHQLHGLPHHTLWALSNKYGPIMLLHLGRVPTLVVSSADIAEEVMKTHDHVLSSRPPLSIPKRLTYGKDIAFTPYGEYWRQVRKICVLQLLNAKKVQSFRIVREQEVALMMETIQAIAASSSSVVNLSKMFDSLSNNIICRVALGRKYGEGEGGSKFRGMVSDFAYLLGVSNVGDFIPSLAWLNYFNGLNARVEKNFKEIDTFLDEVIEEHIKKRSGGGGGDASKEEEDLVDVLLGIEEDNTLGFQLDRDGTKAIILDMFMAGTDTTSTVLEWAMSELIKHPEIMEEVQKEVRDIFGEKNTLQEIDMKDLHSIRLVIKETLRMHPPVPLLVPRESMKSFVMHGYNVPAKTTIMINAFAIGRDPTFWNEPNKFWPKRYYDTEKYSLIDFKAIDFHFIPFGAGRRGCPGILFAISLLDVALANLLYKFDWTLPNGLDIKNFDMEEGYGLTIHRRNELILSVKPHYI